MENLLRTYDGLDGTVEDRKRMLVSLSPGEMFVMHPVTTDAVEKLPLILLIERPSIEYQEIKDISGVIMEKVPKRSQHYECLIMNSAEHQGRYYTLRYDMDVYKYNPTEQELIDAIPYTA